MEGDSKPFSSPHGLGSRLETGGDVPHGRDFGRFDGLSGRIKMNL